MELLEERRDLVRRYLLEEREHDGLTVLDELLGPEADAGEHREAAIVQLDNFLPQVLLGRELVLGPGREALDVRVPARESTGEPGKRREICFVRCRSRAGHVAVLHLEIGRLPSGERRRFDGADREEHRS